MSGFVDGVSTDVVERRGTWHWKVRIRVSGLTGTIGGQSPTKERAEKCVKRESAFARRLIKVHRAAPK